jgi:hypothetical protein
MSTVTVMDKTTNWADGVKYPTEKSSIATARRDIATFLASRAVWVHRVFRASRAVWVPRVSAARSMGVWKPAQCGCPDLPPLGVWVSGSPECERLEARSVGVWKPRSVGVWKPSECGCLQA